VDSDNEDFYYEDDDVAEADSQKLVDDFVAIGKKVSDALVQHSNEESLLQPKRAKLKEH
jgi:CRISPR/Cas system CSM-associated protein Csm5 (group 7 of RAMP superfamily)